MDIISAVVNGLGTFFDGLIAVFAKLGDILFTIGEAGAITGLTPFAWVIVTLIIIGLGTWLFSKGFGLIGKMFKSGK